ncbi:MAG: carbamoyl-phosphate synthase large subunit [Planctomycetota bacterium]|jgi:carbamoyl-phosphate synthase large subunit|nr:carbamoyl-phosphate synthase large subunit [Planctomycetota bacterium]
MPKRTDLTSILIIGSGPIIIGQACEFDYSGTQACKALREEGYRVILVNSNPATIMTDPEMADATYVEPITPEAVTKIIAKERPDAILPTLGGQTGLNTAMALHESGALEKYNCELIGANAEVIKRAEDREVFAGIMDTIGMKGARAERAKTWDKAVEIKNRIGLPVMIRPSFTMGGTGGGFCRTEEEFAIIAKRGMALSRIGEISIEESLLGWKEYELEVMRDKGDNVVIICSIENLDPMGVHTGDSITVAPAQTLSDREYQRMRDAAIKIIRAVGVETGGSNIQFATNPDDGRMVVIEMNPRVSRSSALASKATGFPIAKFAAKLAVGYTLDELQNDITKETPACFEPTIDYVVTKIPRFAFEKFPEADDTLGYQMKSVGEVMAIGRTQRESLQKALRGLEIGANGLGPQHIDDDPNPGDKNRLLTALETPTAARIFTLRHAMLAGATDEELFEATKIDPWFLLQVRTIVEHELHLKGRKIGELSFDDMRAAKRDGFSDRQLAVLTGSSEKDVRDRRWELDVHPVFKLVDTCAAEFAAITPYYYSTYEDECEARVSDREKIMILGGGPNRIGQGIEFDCCCCHAAFALSEAGYETVMVNSNPETVSTDYDTSDQLFFEPLTVEDVLEITRVMKPKGVIVQFGGQTPLNLSLELEAAGVPIIGTSPTNINKAGDRELFRDALESLELLQPSNGIARNLDEAVKVAERVGYPVVVRPSHVLGGRAMEIVFTRKDLEYYMTHAVQASPDAPILIDKFLENATEVDVDALYDGEQMIIGGMLEHIEEAGIHSGDSACVIPGYSLSRRLLKRMREITEALAKALEVRGLMNVQFAIRHEEVYLIEVNPRASRTVPFISKATGLPLAKIASLVQAGQTLKQLGVEESSEPPFFAVKEVVLPWNKFPGVDTILGPEMRSTGEVMGIAPTFGEAFYKAQLGAGNQLPTSGKVFISVRDNDKRLTLPIAAEIASLGYQILSTRGTGQVLQRNGIPCTILNKVQDGTGSVLDHMDQIAFLINTPNNRGARTDEGKIRSACAVSGTPCFTTLASAAVLVSALRQQSREPYQVRSLQSQLPNAGVWRPAC